MVHFSEKGTGGNFGVSLKANSKPRKAVIWPLILSSPNWQMVGCSRGDHRVCCLYRGLLPKTLANYLKSKFFAECRALADRGLSYSRNCLMTVCFVPGMQIVSQKVLFARRHLRLGPVSAATDLIHCGSRSLAGLVHC